MKTSRYLILTLAATLVLGGITHTFAANPARRPGAFQARFIERAREKLRLSDDQVARIKAVFKSDKDVLTDLFTRLHESRISLRKAIRSDTANESAVRAASAQIAAVQADVAVERMKLFARINPILTPEQRTKLAKLEERMDDRADTAIERAGDRVAE